MGRAQNALRYSFPPFRLHGKRTDRPLSSSAPTPVACAADGNDDGDIVPPNLSRSSPALALPPPEEAAGGSSAQTSYAVPFRIKSPTGPPTRWDELISMSRKFLAFSYSREIRIRGNERAKRGGEEKAPGLDALGTYSTWCPDQPELDTIV
jgi:hypothetical protein